MCFGGFSRNIPQSISRSYGLASEGLSERIPFRLGVLEGRRYYAPKVYSNHVGQYRMGPPFDSVQLPYFLNGLILWFMVDITIVDGVYKLIKEGTII
jgi:hypothetical protein